MNEKLTKKEITAFMLIFAAMLGSLVYGYFLIKKENVPAPMSCWEQYQDAGEDVAIRMCEVHDGE